MTIIIGILAGIILVMSASYAARKIVTLETTNENLSELCDSYVDRMVKSETDLHYHKQLLRELMTRPVVTNINPEQLATLGAAVGQYLVENMPQKGFVN